MIGIMMLILLCFMAVVLVLLVRGHAGYGRILLLGLFSTFIVAEIVLYAALKQKGMFLDIALAFALLSFMEVQFYSVYLRRKGEL